MKVVLRYPTFSEMVGGILMVTCPCWFLLGHAWPCLVLGVAHVGCATFFSSIKVSSAWTPSLSFTRASLRTREYLQPCSYSPAHTAEWRILQSTRRPSLPRSALNPHLLWCAITSPRHTWEKPPLHLNLTQQRGLFLPSLFLLAMQGVQ